MDSIEEKKVNCPYCGAEIDNSVERCPNCKEWFVEPHLEGFNLISIPLNVAFMTVFGAVGMFYIYSLIWVFFNTKAFLNIAVPKDAKKFKILLAAAVILVFLTLISKYFIALDVAVFILLSYRMLRIIEKYTLKKYNSPVTHHELGMLFFRVLYVIYYIDTYKQRVYDPMQRYCLEKRKWFEYLVLCIVLSFLLGYKFGYSTIFFVGF